MKGLNIVLVFCLLPLSAVGAESTNQTSDMRLLLEQCGMLDRLQQFPRQVFEAMGHKGGEAQSKRYTPERDAFFQAFNVQEMEQELIASMEEEMDEHNTKVALEWFQSPLGKRITDLERMTYSDQAWQGRQIFVQGLSHNSLEQPRVNKVQQLTEANYLSHIDEDLEMTTALALTRSMNATLPTDEHIDFDQIRQALQVQREEKKNVLQEEQLINFLYLFHRLPDQDIEQYADFLVSETGKKFNSAMRISLNAVFQSASEKIGTALGRALKGEHRI